MKKRVLSGMRPTGKLHLGHWAGALSNWVKLQDEYECFFMAADWHALMSEYKNPGSINDMIVDNVADWLSWGIDPKKSVIFVQSDVKEHVELFTFLSFIVPLGWLFRCPTFKEQITQLKEKDINTYAFLGYPVLQAADILLYSADYVPVGEDQLPHLELTREIVRRFHFLYGKNVFIEPQPLLTSVPKLLGLDGRKMSKSYDNFITLDEQEEPLKAKVLSMFTDPSRIKKSDVGHPQSCNVFSYYKVFFPGRSEQVYAWCVNAEKGCRECKSILSEALIEFTAQKRMYKKKIMKDKSYVRSVLKKGAGRACEFSAKMLKQVKRAVLGV